MATRLRRKPCQDGCALEPFAGGGQALLRIANQSGVLALTIVL
jgi:hypothetical protein